VLGASLADGFDQVLEFAGRLERSPRFRRKLDRVVTTIRRNAVRSADFVVTATAPGFAYRWNPTLQAFDRAPSSQGPVFAEPPQTVGKHTLEIGVSHLYSDFSGIDDVSLEDSLDALREVRGADVLDVRAADFDLRTHVLSFSGTYGISDAWDVNLLVPVLVTRLELRGRSALLLPGAPAFENRFDVDDAAAGIGDVLLRTKHRLPGEGPIETAAALTLRVPSGAVDDFQGLGDVTLTPVVTLGTALGLHEVHLNAGFEVNAGTPARSRLRYALGTTLHVVPALAIVADVLGSSGIDDDPFTENGVRGHLPRSDVVDLSLGLKLRLAQRLVAHLGALVPLTRDGLRADVTPTGGIQARF